MTYRVATPGVIRLSDGKHIIRGMPEWHDYLVWARTHTPLPELVVTPSLATRRAEYARRVDALCQRAINRGPISVGGLRFNADPATLAAFAALGAAVANGMTFPQNFRWRAADGTLVPLTGAQFRTLVQDMVLHVRACKEHAYDLSATIASSSDPGLVDLEGGWPA